MKSDRLDDMERKMTNLDRLKMACLQSKQYEKEFDCKVAIGIHPFIGEIICNHFNEYEPGKFSLEGIDVYCEPEVSQDGMRFKVSAKQEATMLYVLQKLTKEFGK